jgi:hypothetical protein
MLSERVKLMPKSSKTANKTTTTKNLEVSEPETEERKIHESNKDIAERKFLYP